MPKTQSYKGLYAMHKYWGKKPFEQISTFIEKYSCPHDVVMDCFCGSGVTVIEALKSNRKAIGIDLNPIAIKLTQASITRVDLVSLKNAFKTIETAVKEKINSLYTRIIDGQNTLITHVVWQNNVPIEVWYSTDKRKKIIRTGDNVDIEMAENPLIKEKWYPTVNMFENTRINVNKNETIPDLFTKRALVALSLILDEIDKIEDGTVKESLKLAFTGALSQASKLVFVIRRRGKDKTATKAEVGSWVIGYWVPEEHFEINAWNCFENRFKRILKGKEDVNDLINKGNFSDNNYKLYNTSATKLPLQDNQVDYVFIDPPHSNRILYMEQSLMWNAWLKLDRDIQWDDEIVVSEAKERNKSLKNYTFLLGSVFSEIRRVLKPYKMLSMAFNCFDDNTWLEILNLLVKNGFELHSVEPLEYSATSVVQDNRTNALKTDFVFTYCNSNNFNQKSIELKKAKKELNDILNQVKKSNPTLQVYEVINLLFAETLHKGYIYSVSEISEVWCNL